MSCLLFSKRLNCKDNSIDAVILWSNNSLCNCHFAIYVTFISPLWGTTLVTSTQVSMLPQTPARATLTDIKGLLNRLPQYGETTGCSGTVNICRVNHYNKHFFIYGHYLSLITIRLHSFKFASCFWYNIDQYCDIATAAIKVIDRLWFYKIHTIAWKDHEI